MARRRTSLPRGGQARSGLSELCRARLDSVTLRRELRAQLTRLVVFDGYCINTVDPLTLLITSSIGDGLAPAVARRLFEIEDAATDFNPLQQLARGPRHIATIGQATCADVQRSQRMRELFVPLGFRDELRAALVVGGYCWGYLHLFRAGSVFGAEEVARVEEAGPTIAMALRAACLLGQRRRATAAPAALLLDERGRLLGAGVSASDWLAGFASDVGGATPHPLLAVVSRVLCGTLPANGRYRTPLGDWVSLDGSALGDDVVLTLSAPPARELLPVWSLAHNLSVREREVCGLLLEGHSNDAIAGRLGISLYTTKDHVKVIFEKTGAGSRVGLLSGLQA
jgi:DNA-binding CsgD family transcriptional regulator